MTIVLGAYTTEAEAQEALAARREPANELAIVQDGVDQAHPFRIYWTRA